METYTTLAGGENPAAGHHRLLLFVPLEENLHQQAIGHSTPHPWRRHRIRTESTDNIYTRMQRPSNEKRGKAGSIPRGAKPPARWRLATTTNWRGGAEEEEDRRDAPRTRLVQATDEEEAGRSSGGSLCGDGRSESNQGRTGGRGRQSGE
jgi:hypothetical protein